MLLVQLDANGSILASDVKKGKAMNAPTGTGTTNNIIDTTWIVSITLVILYVLYFINPEGRFDTLTNFAPGVISLCTAGLMRLPIFRTRSLTQQTLVASLMSVTILITTPMLYQWWEQREGRAVRNAVSGWIIKREENFDGDVPYLYLGQVSNDRASSDREVIDKQYSLTMQSNTNATDMAGFQDVTPSLQDFYVAATVTKLPGPRDSYCGLIFGHEGKEQWLFFRLQEDGSFSISRNRGSLPHDRIVGPDTNPIISRRGSNRMFVLSQNGLYRFFVNDVEVYQTNRSRLSIPIGKFDLGVQTPDFPGVVTCTFDDFELRSPSR